MSTSQSVTSATTLYLFIFLSRSNSIAAPFFKPPLPNSTFDNFIAQLNTIRSTLPVTEAEAGDTWVTSTTADANKMIFYREASRAYAECLANNQCDIHDPRVLGFTRMLAKIPEHTCK
jgi:hypothetical protein